MSDRFSFSSFSCCYFCLLVVALFHLSLCEQNVNNILCRDEERQALIQFKHGLIDETDRLASWDDGEESDCCKWTGIVCDNFTGHVHWIHLPAFDGHCRKSFDVPYEEYKEYEEASKRRLRGDLSPSLLHLKQLRHLDLSCNDFEGIYIPSFIGSLGNLRYLNLSRSKFGGIIPPQLGNLSELNILSLGSFHDAEESTSLMNMKWLSSLRWLHHLDMSGVDLSKANDWLQVINSLPSLVQLHLAHSRLAIYPHVPSLNTSSLSLLDLSSTNIDSSMAQWIFSITSLVSLDLSHCIYLDVLIPNVVDTFRNLTSLKFLDVGWSDFESSPLVFEGLSSTVGSKLISLDISLCGVSSSDLDSLHNLTSLLSLDLSNNQLTKAIPKSLCNFCDLRDLDLSDNNFFNLTLTSLLESFFECKSPRLESFSIHFSGPHGPIPDRIGKLIRLVHLLLPENNIDGIIPDSIGQLSFLRSLDLRMNQLSGPIPYSIGQVSSLEVLDLSHNQVDGSLPDSLGQLSKLVSLDFSSNSLTGVVTEVHFAKLESLKHLDGKGNNLTLRRQLANWIPPFQMQKLYLNSWVLGPQFPLWLQSQRDLIELDISNTQISSPMPRSFWRSFPNLTYLDMSQNHIQGTIRFLGIPANLHLLDLSTNEFTGKLPDLSNGSSPLMILDLSNNLFVGSLNHLLCSNGVREIIVLDLGNNNISGVIPECWEKWPRLFILNLENNNLSGRIPRTLGFSSDLVALSMHGNKLSGSLPACLMNLTNLAILQLSKNELVGSIPAWFGRELSALRLLNLRSNNFTGNIPYELCYLRNIQILDLAHNNLSGNIPSCFNNFSILSGKETTLSDPFKFRPVYSRKDVITSDSLVMKGREDKYSTILQLVMLLDLSNNNISGNIPSELTALLKLKSLNLSRNQLTGRIPEKIGDMESIENLDLSLNKLSGELPMSLSSMSFLSSFNVSYNNLTGRVPLSTQLQSFNESSFFGNKLCGDPLIDPCVRVKVPKTVTYQQEDDVSHGVNWGFIISIVFGFAIGFWIVVAPLIFCRPWRIAYFGFLTKLRYMVYDVMHKYCLNVFPK